MKRFAFLAGLAILIITGGQAFACTAYGGCSAAADPITIAMLRPLLISPTTPLTQIRYCPPHERAACRRGLRDCKRINGPACLQGYHECIEECHAGD